MTLRRGLPKPRMVETSFLEAMMLTKRRSYS